VAEKRKGKGEEERRQKREKRWKQMKNEGRRERGAKDGRWKMEEKRV
jgi:hypothetical protein